MTIEQDFLIISIRRVNKFCLYQFLEKSISMNITDENFGKSLELFKTKYGIYYKWQIQ